MPNSFVDLLSVQYPHNTCWTPCLTCLAHSINLLDVYNVHLSARAPPRTVLAKLCHPDKPCHSDKADRPADAGQDGRFGSRAAVSQQQVYDIDRTQSTMSLCPCRAFLVE